MAKTKLSTAGMVKKGYAQVEPNHLSAKRNGQIYAQLPAAHEITVLENGMFAKYDYAKGVVDFSTEDTSGEWMLVFNEVKVYKDGETDADFAMVAENYDAYVYNAAGDLMKGITRETGPSYGYDLTNATKMVPRLFRTQVGDIYTTNGIADETVAVGDKLKVDETTHFLKKEDPAEGEMCWVVVKVYTMPDGQPGVKVQRVA